MYITCRKYQQKHVIDDHLKIFLFFIDLKRLKRGLPILFGFAVVFGNRDKRF